MSQLYVSSVGPKPQSSTVTLAEVSATPTEAPPHLKDNSLLADTFGSRHDFSLVEHFCNISLEICNVLLDGVYCSSRVASSLFSVNEIIPKLCI